MESIHILMVAACIAVPLLIFAFVWDSEIRRQRMAKISVWLEERGFEAFSPYVRYGVDLFPHARFFENRNWSRIYNVFRATKQNMIVWFFEHNRKQPVKNPKNYEKHWWEHSALVLQHSTDTGHIIIRPEHPFERQDVLNFHSEDIDFESTEFSDAFYVLSDDRRKAYQIIHLPVMELLLNHQDYWIEYSGKYLMLSNGKKWDTNEFHEALALGEMLVDLIPEYLKGKDDASHIGTDSSVG